MVRPLPSVTSADDIAQSGSARAAAPLGDQTVPVDVVLDCAANDYQVVPTTPAPMDQVVPNHTPPNGIDQVVPEGPADGGAQHNALLLVGEVSMGFGLFHMGSH